MRKPNTNRTGKNFTKAEEKAVWEKAQATNDPNIKLDICGNQIEFDKYGNTNSDYGWEIDHIKPVAKNGTDELNNLQPLYWKTNRIKGDSWPVSSQDYCQKN